MFSKINGLTLVNAFPVSLIFKIEGEYEQDPDVLDWLCKHIPSGEFRPTNRLCSDSSKEINAITYHDHFIEVVGRHAIYSRQCYYYGQPDGELEEYDLDLSQEDLAEIVDILKDHRIMYMHKAQLIADAICKLEGGE